MSSMNRGNSVHIKRVIRITCDQKEGRMLYNTIVYIVANPTMYNKPYCLYIVANPIYIPCR